MTRKTLLSEAWWHQATTIPDDDRLIARHYTLERSDLDLIMRQNKDANRLGLACVIAMLRYRDVGLSGTVYPHNVCFFFSKLPFGSRISERS